MTDPHNRLNTNEGVQQNPTNNNADGNVPNENPNARRQGTQTQQYLPDIQFIQFPFMVSPIQSLIFDHIRNLNNLTDQPPTARNRHQEQAINQLFGINFPQDPSSLAEPLEDLDFHHGLRMYPMENHPNMPHGAAPDGANFINYFRPPINLAQPYPQMNPQFAEFNQFLAPYAIPLSMLQEHQFWGQANRNIPGRRNIPRPNQANLPNHINKKYYNKAPTERTYPTTYSESDPYLRVSYVKQNDNNQEESYQIISEGLVNSKKNTDINDIMIGRQMNIQIDGVTIYPNDIVLPINDRAISRVHCKISLADGFQSKDQMQKDFEEFQRICYLSKSFWRNTPKNVLNLIREFAQQSGHHYPYTPAQFYIQDLGSVQGTYLKVRNNRDNLIETGNIYFIGAETLFHVKQCVQETFGDPQSEEYFYDILAYFKNVEKDELHGLTPAELAIIEQRVAPKHLYNQNDMAKLTRPFVKIDFQQMNPNSKHIFVARIDPKQSQNRGYLETSFKFGRNQDNDVVINFNTISRKQCRIKYCPIQRKWFISDGEANRESSNGTWMSVCDWYEKQEKPREESRKRVLEPNTEIKISESVLKVEMINFHKLIRKKQQKENEKRHKFLHQLMLQFGNDE